MAIEFHCPYCTATVRVGDDASGKIGRCPKCDTRLRVPTIPSPAPQTAPSPETGAETPVDPPANANPVQLPTADSLQGQADPGFAGPPEGAVESPAEEALFPDLNAPKDPKTLGQLPVVPVTDDPVTSKYIRRQKKKRASLSGLIPPILFGSIFVSVGIWFYMSSQPSYEGLLEGERLNPSQSIRLEIKGADFSIDQKVFSQIVDEVRKRPSAVRSNLVNLQFSAGSKGLEISLRPGSEADLVKVPILQLEAVDQYYQEHLDTLEDARLDELKAGLISLSEDWTNAPEGEKNSTLPNYRNQVVYNSFVKGLGRICYASVGNAIYPCVHENSEGDLYFLVPVGTKEFWIKERSELPETPFFPSSFLVHVQVARPQLEEAELVPVENASEEEATGEEDSSPTSDESMEPDSDAETSPNMKSSGT
ncbi:hypothetical protein [Thalassoglobus polymorphus]|uniref:Uncharacterized protein n=1 Tax=Thalassoglobus polymorphus TaxID=2527994 RepID=A0A517QP48_9PLAN|nr:hypothetical protein [Thalassoglobus polymorphus]QDT33357.1 hypothetical protein Mal48_26100 [Thalassoglobus polymorphus]